MFVYLHHNFMSRIVFNVATSSYALFRRTGIHEPYANGEANDVINLSKCAFGNFKFDKLLANIKYIPGVAGVIVVVFIDGICRRWDEGAKT